MLSLTDTRVNGVKGTRMIAVIRLILASLALLIVFYIDPSETTSNIARTYAVLASYIAYSAIFFALVLRRRPFLLVSIAHWVDVGWYVALMGISGGANSIFFFFLFSFFSILVASFQKGFRSGLRVTFISVALLTGVSFMMVAVTPDYEFKRMLLQPVYLFVFGYMVSCWGEIELTHKRRLALLKDISRLSNPRFGIDHTIGSIMEQLRAFYEADACVLVMADPAMGGYSLRHANRHDPAAAGQAKPITQELANILLGLPAIQAIIYRGKPHAQGGWHPEANIYAYNVKTSDPGACPLYERVVIPDESGACLTKISNLLAAESFIMVPFCCHGETIGQLYLTTSRQHAFGISDVGFLCQVLDQTMPVIDNIRLVDRLASDAIEVERRRIACDLHDSVIQPYIGLQLGLSGIQQKFAMGSSDVKDDIERLMQLAAVEITNLRHYVAKFRNGGGYETNLQQAVERFARKFTDTTGISVQVKADADIHIHDRLAAEVFQMMAEGLSNIRRHTNSTQALISLAFCNDHLILGIENDLAEGEAFVSFTPDSITERAEALGGCVRTELTEHGTAIVVVEIPL